MADTDYAQGTQVQARKYIVDKNAALDGKTGVVETVADKVITVYWGDDVGRLEMRASHIMRAKNGDNGSSTQASTSSTTEAPEANADRALDPDAPEITDGDVEAMRSERQRIIGHLLEPGDEHDHGSQERAESTIRAGSLHDLRAWHSNAHKQDDPSSPPHEL
jgi:hypothetical protein